MNTAEDLLVGMDERNVSERDMSYRAMKPVAPSTINRETRSLEFVATTEDPVLMFDWERGEYVPEVLLAKGISMSKQVPLLDTHSRYSVSAVLGSARNKVVEEENKLVSATAFFSKVKEGEDAFTKYEEGHLTDFSVGYRVNAKTYVEKGKTAEIGGRTFKGPVNVATSTTIKEISCCPIGADKKAKVRADLPNQNKKLEDTDMTEEDKKRMEELEGKVGGIDGKLDKLTGLVEKSLAPRLKVEEEEKSLQETREADIARRVAEKEKAELAERTRINEIHKMCDRFDIDDDSRGKLILDGTDVNKARELVMERAASRMNENGLSIKMGAEDRTKKRTAMAESLLLRAGIGVEKIEDKNNEYRSYSISDIAKDCLRMNNIPVPIHRTDIIKRALSTDDFDNILSDAAQKSLYDGFEKADETYAEWCDTTGVLNDYKAHQFSRASEAPSLQPKNHEGGEYEYAAMSDTKESVTASDYGIIVPFTKGAMVNDDLGALEDIRMKLGESAARKWGDLVYAVLSGGTALTMGDGVALFHASHSNYVTGATAFSVANLNTAYAAMATQKDLQGIQNLNIRPQYVLCAHAMKGTVEQILVQTQPVVVGSAATPAVNPFPLTPIYESRLDTADSTAWWLAARKGKTVKLFTLNGQLMPNLASKVDWTTDNIDFKCDISGAAKAMDYRGLYYAT